MPRAQPANPEVREGRVGSEEESLAVGDTLPEMFVQLSMYLADLPVPGRFHNGQQHFTGRMSA
jgi:hypothetical protein